MVLHHPGCRRQTVEVTFDGVEYDAYADETIIQAANRLGVDIPSEPPPEVLQAAAERAAAAWQGRTIEELVSTPVMTDRDKLAAMDIMANLYIPAFNSAPNVFTLIVASQSGVIHHSCASVLWNFYNS